MSPVTFVPAGATVDPAASPPRPSPAISYKERIRHEWDAVAADWADDRWYRVVERSAQTCNDRLVELAGLQPGHVVLDVGTGIGEPAVTAARRVAPGGRVLGIDLAPGMIREGRRRIRHLGLPNVELTVGDVESLDLPAAAFDAVLSRWTLMLMEDLETTLAGLLRLLAPGGMLAAGLWGHPRRVPMVSAALGAALELLRIPAPPPEAPGHLWARGSDTLEALAREAGFSDVRTESLDLVFDLPSPEHYAEFVYRMAGPVRVLVDSQPERVARDLLDVFARAARSFRRPDGTVRFVNETILLVGRRPQAQAV